MYSPFVLYRAVSPNHYCNYLGKNTYSCYNTIRNTSIVAFTCVRNRETREGGKKFYFYILNLQTSYI